MVKNYFKIAWRNIKSHKAYSGINILGLAIGIAACMLILQYVSFELSYEDFHADKNRIYRVQQDRYDNGKLSTQWAAGAYAAGNSFKDAIPEVEDYVKLVKESNLVATINNQPIKIEKAFFASASFFKIFSYPLLEGDSKTALTEPNTAVLSETTARNLFGNENAVGKTVLMNGRENFKITGVYKDLPANTQLQADMLLSYITFVNIVKPNGNDPETAWNWDGCLTYLLLRKDANPKAVEAKFIPIVEKVNGADLKKYNAAAVYKLQPLTDIHLYSNYMQEPEPNGDGKTVYLLLGIAFFIVVIAWVNYINLATARAISRAKEVGVRKSVGSQRRQLIFQFLFESALLNGIALLLALLLMALALPVFNSLSGQHLSFSLITKENFWLALAGLFIGGVVLSGIYPAFVLSGFNPVEVLKGKMVTTAKGAMLRKSLVVFQFTASLFLLIGTLAVYKQIQFMRNQSLGIHIDKTLIVTRPVITDSTYAANMTSFKNELLQNTSITKVAALTSIPGQAIDWNAGGIKLVGTDESKAKQYRVIGVDYDFVDLFQLKLIAGRKFSKDFGSDPNAVLFNKAGIEQLGFTKPEEAIGKKIDFWGEQYTIAGVTENFHNQSLKEAYEPLIIRLIPDVQGYFAVKTNAGQSAQTIEKVKTAWSKFFPGNTFDYFFLDDHFNNQYKADQRFGQVFGFFTLLAILVASLGLFGLASFTTLQRTKEIGIRKVLGSSVAGILNLLYREFAILLMVAFVIAVPLAWFTVSNWLQGYAFRINIHWSFFAVPFVAIVLIALFTVSFQTIKAAVANPIKSLRTE
jgi:putative ABC transport system permease protein